MKTKYNSVECTDDKGIKYGSIGEMCRANGIAQSAYSYWSNKGLSIEEIKNRAEFNERTVFDHLGAKFVSVREMVKYWGITSADYREGIKQGLRLEEILNGKMREIRADRKAARKGYVRGSKRRNK